MALPSNVLWKVIVKPGLGLLGIFFNDKKKSSNVIFLQL